MARLTIHRDATRWVDRARAYKAEVDGVVVGTVAHGQSFTTELSPGAHDVRMAIDWCGSQTIGLDGRSDVELTCRANATPLTVTIYAFFLRNRYIGLDRTA